MCVIQVVVNASMIAVSRDVLFTSWWVGYTPDPTAAGRGGGQLDATPQSSRSSPDQSH